MTSTSQCMFCSESKSGFCSRHGGYADPPAVRNTDPQTSHDAFQSINVSARQALIMEKAREKAHEMPTFTASEMAKEMGLARDSVSNRLSELGKRGLIVLTGERRTWGETKHTQQVWAVAEEEEA